MTTKVFLGDPKRFADSNTVSPLQRDGTTGVADSDLGHPIEVIDRLLNARIQSQQGCPSLARIGSHRLAFASGLI